MVTGGNVTGITDQLVREGHVQRQSDPEDRRSTLVSLTPAGRRHFLRMAAEHEQWLVELFDGFDAAQKTNLYDTLGRLRVHLAERAAARPRRSPAGKTAPRSAPKTLKERA